MHLIVLDDESRIANFIAVLARERGWTADIAGNDKEFQALYNAKIPDAIMLDLQLGSSDGIEEMRFLREVHYSGVIALMSGFDSRVLASAQQVGRSFGLRIASVLEKPARASRIREVLEEIENRLTHATPMVSGRTGFPAGRETENILPDAVANALRNGEMELHLQPILNAKDHSVVQLEGLIRWRHPTYGMVLPDQFIPIAERDQSVIDGVTSWVIETALNQYRRLATSGFTIPIAVNLSGMNLHSLDFPDRLAALVASANLPPSALALEITESVAMHGSSAIIDVLTRLRLKGFQLAIDDLGTGYSTLKALRQIPFSEIKIDKSFIADVLQSKESRAIVTSIIDLAGRMNLICVAEGVESGDIATLLTNLGIDRLQGYFYSRPVPFDNLAEWLAAWPTTPHPAKSGRSSG